MLPEVFKILRPVLGPCFIIAPLLKVHVSDINGQDIMISFYDNSTGSPILIGTDAVYNGGPGNASVSWSGLCYNTIYQWFAVAFDGVCNATTPTFSFTTGEAPLIPFFLFLGASEEQIFGYNLLILISVLGISIALITQKLRKSK
ncbi:MAG: hypothetical protein BAJALOKI1v1_2190003 [Promethearchaeota archaeon]|nr:MAG: hypothetical protein BAJALOKI1v1_2190003 [Candidatus Lokiarchaeota archaeon]